MSLEKPTPKKVPEGGEKLSGAEALKALIKKFKENGRKIQKLLVDVNKILERQENFNTNDFIKAALKAGINFNSDQTLIVLIKLGEYRGDKHFTHQILEYMITGKSTHGGIDTSLLKPASLKTLVSLAQEKGLYRRIYKYFLQSYRVATWEVASTFVDTNLLLTLWDDVHGDKRAHQRLLFTARGYAEVQPSKEHERIYKILTKRYDKEYPMDKFLLRKEFFTERGD
jgi:hypothetical protein